MSIRSTNSISLRDPSILATIDMEQQIQLLDQAIRPLRKGPDQAPKVGRWTCQHQLSHWFWNWKQSWQGCSSQDQAPTAGSSHSIVEATRSSSCLVGWTQDTCSWFGCSPSTPWHLMTWGLGVQALHPLWYSNLVILNKFVWCCPHLNVKLPSSNI